MNFFPNKINNKHHSLKVFSVVNKMIKKIFALRNTYELVKTGQWGYKPLVGDPPMGSYQVVSFLPSMIKQDLWIHFL